jgi:hypothetical protein
MYEVSEEFSKRSLAGARFHEVDLRGVRIRAAYSPTSRSMARSGSTVPVPDPGWPTSKSYPVLEVLGRIVNEEWWHRQFAERDLDALDTSRSTSAPGLSRHRHVRI